MNEPEILTPRLRLGALRVDDATTLLAYRSDEALKRFLTWEPVDLEDARHFIRAQEDVSFGRPGQWFQLGIHRRDTDALVGDLGIHVLSDEPRQVEIGYALSPEHQGQGFATEAVTALLDHLLGPLGKHRVTASVDPRNVASVALMDRVGFRREAHHRQSLWFKGAWADDYIYAVLAADWPPPQ